MTRAAWRDGVQIVAPAHLPTTPHLFETIGRFGNRLPLWPHHLTRLRAGLAARGWLRLGEPPDLAAAALALLAENGEDVARVAVWPDAGRLTWLVTTRRRDTETEPLSVRLGREARPPGDPSLKFAPRTWLDAERRAAQAAGAHDALVWRGTDLLEATAYNVFVAHAGALRTPPLTAALLPGIARGVLLAELRRVGVLVVEARLSLDDLAGGALILTNAVYGPRRARLTELPLADPGQAWVDLRAAWSRLVDP